MDSITSICNRISELEDKINECWVDEFPEYISDYQQELDTLTAKLTKLENNVRKEKSKPNWHLFD